MTAASPALAQVFNRFVCGRIVYSCAIEETTHLYDGGLLRFKVTITDMHSTAWIMDLEGSVLSEALEDQGVYLSNADLKQALGKIFACDAIKPVFEGGVPGSSPLHLEAWYDRRGGRPYPVDQHEKLSRRGAGSRNEIMFRFPPVGAAQPVAGVTAQDCCRELNEALMERYLQLTKQNTELLADNRRAHALKLELTDHIQALMSSLTDLLPTGSDGPFTAAVGYMSPLTKRPRIERAAAAGTATPTAGMYSGSTAAAAAGSLEGVTLPMQGALGGGPSYLETDPIMAAGSPSIATLGFGGSQLGLEAAPAASAGGTAGGGGSGRGKGRGMNRQGSGKQSKGKPQMSPQAEAASRLLAQVQRKMAAISAAGGAEAWGLREVESPEAPSQGRGPAGFEGGPTEGKLLGSQAVSRAGEGQAHGAVHGSGPGVDGAAAAAAGGSGAAAAGLLQQSEGAGGVAQQHKALVSHPPGTGDLGSQVELLSQVGRAVQVPSGRGPRLRSGRNAAALAMQVMSGARK